LFIFMFTPFPFVLTDYGLDWFVSVVSININNPNEVTMK